MLRRAWYRFAAGQFARPSGWLGRHLFGPWLDRIGHGMNRFALARLEPVRGERILEIGFGGGDLIDQLLRSAPAQVIGVDVSSAMVDRGRRRFAGTSGVSLHLASVERLPLADGSVDKAVSVNNVYFWPDIAAAFAELARVLRPGAILVLCFEPPEELAKWPGHRHGFRAYRDDELKILASAAGFGCPQIEWGSGRKPDRFLCLSLVNGAARLTHDD